jgi:hypothetical protein
MVPAVTRIGGPPAAVGALPRHRHLEPLLVLCAAPIGTADRLLDDRGGDLPLAGKRLRLVPHRVNRLVVV